MLQRSVFLDFPKAVVDQPWITRVIRDYDVEVNILQAAITPDEGGRMFAIFRGEPPAVKAALTFLRDARVDVVEPEKFLVWREDRCVHCTACTGQCPSGSFTVDPQTRRITFVSESCIACELCIQACFYGALHSFTELEMKPGVF